MEKFMNIICLLTSLLFLSCTPSDSRTEEGLCMFKLNGAEIIEIPADDEACELAVSVFCDGQWTIDENAEWISLSPSSGDMTIIGTFVKISVSANPSEDSREAVLYLKSGNITKTLTVIQKGRIVLQDTFEDAFTAVRNLGVGWNLGNTMDTWLKDGPDGSDWRAWETGWGQSVTRPELMHMMKDAGFGAIRVPVTWGPHMDASGRVYDTWMNRVHEIVDYVLDAGLYCIVNLHHDTGEGKDAWVVADKDVYERNRDRYIYLWKQVAEEFKDYDHRLIFESFNEILDSRSSWCFPTCGYAYDSEYALSSYAAVNSFAQSFVDAVRSTGGNNLYRNLVVNTYAAASGSGSWSQYLKDPLIHLEKPDDVSMNHIIFQVHSYPDISDMNAVKAEVDAMFASLDEHLVSKGAPVIVGEWGTSQVDTAPDYIHRHEAMLEFADYFVRKAKQYEMAVFYWMGLSNAAYRTIPVFNEPDLAETIVKAYHGQGYTGIYPSLDDFDISYRVKYNQQWAELSMGPSPLSLDDYSGIRVILASDPANGVLSVKMYGNSDGKEQYNPVTSKDGSYMFDSLILGPECKRITLQYMNKGTFETQVISAFLIRKDGEEEVVRIEPYWGCSVDIIAE